MSDGDEGREDDLPEQVDADEARLLVGGGKVRVIDVRSAEEFAEERINGSVHCEPDDVADEMENESGGREAVMIVCADGSRSAEIAEELRGGERQVTTIDGGFGAWTGDHLPTAPNPDEEYDGPKQKLPGAVASSGDPDEDDEQEGEGEEEEKAEDA